MKQKAALIFYIGNGVVKGSIVSYEQGKPPRVLSARVRDLPHYNERDRDHLESKILTEFAALASDVRTDDFKSVLASHDVRIERACVMVASPWYVSETTVIKMNEAKPFVVTDKLLSDARENIIKAYTDANKVDVAVLEQKIIRISLNGYVTNEPLKKKADSLDMTIFTSFARHSSVTEIHRVIDQNFHIDKTYIHSQSLIAFSVIEDVWKDIPQYIIADITSELTELVTVRKGTLSEAASFPKGKQFLVSTVGQKLGVTSEVAESLIRMKNDGSVDSGLAAKLETALAESKKDWLASFTEGLSAMSSSSSLPSKFFLFAPKDVTHIFSGYITSEEYQQFSFAEGKFEVQEVSVLDLNKYCDADAGVELDLSLLLGALFNSKLERL